MASNIARASPLASVRRDQANIDPLAFNSGNSSPQQQQQNRNFSPKAGLESAPFQRLMLPAEILEIESRSFITQCRKPALVTEEVPPTYEGLLIFSASSSWQGVVKLSWKLLQEPLESPDKLSSITSLRFEGLYRMKLYDELATEATNILLEEEKRMVTEGENYEFNFNITVSMRLLLNDVKIMTGRSEEALEQLLTMHKWLTSLPEQSIVTFWLWQVKCHVVNGYIRLRNWKAATLEMNHMLNEIQRLVQSCVDTEERSNLIKAQIIVSTRLARLLFQIGSVKKGSLYYEKASALLASDNAVARDEALQTQVLLTQGLQLFSTEQFEQAMDLFGTIIDTEGGLMTEHSSVLPAAAPISACTGTREAAVVAALSVFDLQARSQADGSNLAVAVNNLSICALYVKQIRTAITRLEQLILLDPARHLTDPVVFNLCTLYDLSYAPDASMTKKKVIQRVANEYHVDDPILHWRSFRLS